MIPGAGALQSIVATIWSSTLGIDPAPLGAAPGASPGTEPSPGSRVYLTGAWRGCVELACPPALAVAFAAGMFHVPADAIGPAEVQDALGELTNMLAGNIKSLLPSPTFISLPGDVSDGEASGAAALSEGFECPTGCFTVRLYTDVRSKTGPTSVFPTAPRND